MHCEPEPSHHQALLTSSGADANTMNSRNETPVSMLPPEREQPLDLVQCGTQGQQKFDNGEEQQSSDEALTPTFAVNGSSSSKDYHHTPLPPPEGRWGTVVALLALCTMCQANVFMLPYLFSVPASHGASASLQLDLDLSETAFGLLQSYVGIVPRLVCIVGTGKLSARALPSQKRKIVVASGAFMLLGLGLYVVAQSVHTLGVAVVLVNVGVGVNTPMNAILVGDMFDRSSRAMPMACIVCADYLGSGLAGVAAAAAVGLDSWRLTVAGYAAATLAATMLAVAFVIFAPSVPPLRPSDLGESVPEISGRIPSEDCGSTLDASDEERRNDLHFPATNGDHTNDVRSPLFGYQIDGSSLGGGRIAPQQQQQRQRRQAHQQHAKLLPPPRTAAGNTTASVSGVRAIAGVAAISVDRHFTEGTKAHPTFHQLKSAAAGPSSYSSGKHTKSKNGSSSNHTNVATASNAKDNRGSIISPSAAMNNCSSSSSSSNSSNPPAAVPSTIQEHEIESTKQQLEARSSEGSREGSHHRSSSRRGSSIVLGRRSVSILDGSVGYEHNGYIWDGDGDGGSGGADDSSANNNGTYGGGGVAVSGSRDSGSSSRWSLINATRQQQRPITVICASPKLLLVFLGGGIRYGAGMSIASYNPQFFAAVFPGHAHLVAFSVHASISVIVCGTVAQLGSGYLTQHWFPGLTLPMITSLGGGLAAVAMYLQSSFGGAVALLYATYFLGEGWFVGVLTTLQQALPPGAPRDAGLGLFFASSVLIGAADVFATSQSGIGEVLAEAEDSGEGTSSEGTSSSYDDDGIANENSSTDDGPSTDSLAGIWHWLLGEDTSNGSSNSDVRRTMVLCVGAMYLASGAVFLLAAAAPTHWPSYGGLSSSKRRPRPDPRA